ncbi:MAG: hypothetical protein KAX49_16775 [Halanaerobiales bacterium]|nr:hypothetical protein [Halanaerobiales bacterium]
MPYVVSKGLTAFYFNIILAITMFTIFLFEIPTGAFADLLGRKRSFILSLLLMAVAKVVFMISNTMLGLLFCAGTITKAYGIIAALFGMNIVSG